MVMISINHSLPPQIHQNPLHSVVGRLRPPPVEYVGYSKHASFTDTVAGTRQSIGSIATPSTTDFALLFVAAPDDVHAFRWCSQLPRDGRHHVLMFLPSFPSIIINQSVVHLEGQTCPPPPITAFANGLSARAKPGSRRSGERFGWRRVPPVSVDFMPVSIQRCAFFLTVERHNEAVPVVSRSLRVALPSHRTESS